MDADLLFSLANYSVLPGWFLLLLLPRTQVTRLVVHSYFYPVVLAVVYGALLIPNMFGDGEGSMSSIAGLQAGFENPYVLIAAWVHYLVFDLFIGAWEARDSVKQGIPHWQLAPCLVLTLFLGPLGLLLYLLIRFFHTRKLTIA